MKEKKEKKLQNPNLIKEEIMSKEDKKLVDIIQPPSEKEEKPPEPEMGIYCPRCHFDNLADTFYCGKCATPLPSSIDYTKIYEVKEEAEETDPDLKYDSPNDSHTAIIKRLRHFGEFCGDDYSKEERMALIKMIQEKDYTALFIEYFKAQIEMIFYGEHLSYYPGGATAEIVSVQAEIMCSIPIEFKKELFNRLKEGVDESIKWWLEGRLKMKEDRIKKVQEDEDEVPF